MLSFRRVLPVLAATLGVFQGCGSTDDSSREMPVASDTSHTATPAEAFAEAIEHAHGLAAWREKSALRADITVVFQGNVMLEADMLMTTDMARTRVERADGSVAIWDGKDAWVSPAEAEFPMARFHVLTWPYFLSAPMKLRDPGALLDLLGEKELGGTTYETARLTFEPGTGDTSDDWYVLYRDTSTGRLHAMAYIVTYGTTVDQAEQEPHGISFGEFVEVEGVRIPTQWSFWLWSEEEGFHGESIGAVTLRDVTFVEPEEGAFEVPGEAAKHALPTG